MIGCTKTKPDTRSITEILLAAGYVHGPSPIPGTQCVWHKTTKEYQGMFRSHEVLEKLGLTLSSGKTELSE